MVKGPTNFSINPIIPREPISISTKPAIIIAPWMLTIRNFQISSKVLSMPLSLYFPSPRLWIFSHLKFFWDDIRAMTGGRKANEPPCIMGSLSADLTSFHADSELILQMKSAFLVPKVTWSRVEIPDVKNIVDKIFDFARRAKPEGGSKSPDWSRHNDGAIINAIATFDPKQVRKCWNPSTFY